MVKILTALEAELLETAFEAALEVLVEEGYDYQAKDVKDALKVLAGLTEKELESILN